MDLLLLVTDPLLQLAAAPAFAFILLLRIPLPRLRLYIMLHLAQLRAQRADGRLQARHAYLQGAVLLPQLEDFVLLLLVSATE